MAEQGGPNLTGKKGHFETNKVEGDRSGVLGSVGATEAGATSSSYVAPGSHEGGVEPQGGPSMTANLDHRRGVPRYKGPRGVAENLHTDTSLRPVRASQRAARRDFTPDIDDLGDPYLGPRGDPAEGRTGAYEGQDSGDPWLGARGDPAEGRRFD
jgi:hypothetical protein